MIGGAVGINAAKQAKEVDATNSTYNKIASLTAGDEVLIVAFKNNTYYYLPVSGGASSAPTASTVTVSNNSIDADLDTNLFTVEASENNWKFKNGDDYLYTTNNNNGIRVGSNANNVYEVTSTNAENNYYKMKNVGQNRFVGVYNTQDWRSYTSVTQSNYGGSGEKIMFFKKAATKTLSSISVATAPTKTTYYAGEYFDPTGLVITRTYSDSTSDTYSYANHTNDFAFEPSTSTALTVQNTSVTITYGGKTATQAITVNAPRTMTGIELHGAINKTEYYVGDSWDLSGLDIKVNWSEGDPTFVDFDDNDVVYECDPATATSTSIDSFNIEVMYADFDEVFTVDGLTVSEHPLADELTGSVVGVQGAAYTSGWASITNVEDYTGAKYMFRTMKPASGYTMSTNANGYMVTTYCPAGIKLKSISFSFLTNEKNLAIYASNSAYTAGTAPSGETLGTVSGTGGSASFDFSTLNEEYSYVAFKGTGSSTVVGTITIEYEEIIPEITASPSTIDLASGLTRTAEITVNKFINTPSLSCNVISGASSIASASVGAVNNQNKATLTIEASNQPGTAVIRVSASQNQNTYHVDVTVNVLESSKSIIENNIDSQASLSFRYTKHSISDTLTVTSIANNGGSYSDWADRAGDTTDAVYAGNTYAGNDTAIQLRTDGEASGIVTTTSGGNATWVTVAWGSSTQSGRGIEIYGKNTPYSSASDLYGENKGTLIGTIVIDTGTSLQLTGDYAYIGIKSINSAVYLNSLEIEWGATFDYSNVGMRFGGSIDKTLWEDLDASSSIEGYGVMISTSNSIKTRYNAVETSEGSIDGAFETVQNQGYKLVKGTDIRAFYNQVSTAPAENGNNYFWNLFQRVNNTGEALNRAYTAVAFIRTANDGIVFLGEVTKSVTQLAGEIVSANPSENLTSEGALAYLAGLAN